MLNENQEVSSIFNNIYNRNLSLKKIREEHEYKLKNLFLKQKELKMELIEINNNIEHVCFVLCKISEECEHNIDQVSSLLGKTYS